MTNDNQYLDSIRARIKYLMQCKKYEKAETLKLILCNEEARSKIKT